MMNADNLAVSAAGVSADAPGPKSLSCCESSSLRLVETKGVKLLNGSTIKFLHSNPYKDNRKRALKIAPVRIICGANGGLRIDPPQADPPRYRENPG